MNYKGIIFIILFFLFSNLAFAEDLYYLDSDNNGKIDELDLEFDFDISGDLNYEKIFLYSNEGGLSSSKIDGENIFNNYEIDGNILKLYFEEQDLYNLDLNITNTTSSDLRLKTNSGNGIFIGDEELKLRYTSSFSSYENVYFKEVETDDILINEEDEEIKEKEFYINFQNPSYITDKTLGLEEYFCDQSYDICKINFSLLDENGEQISNYNCIWDFGELTGEENKCNPNTIEISNYENNISVNIYDGENLVYTKILKFFNEKYLETEVENNSEIQNDVIEEIQENNTENTQEVDNFTEEITTEEESEDIIEDKNNENFEDENLENIETNSDDSDSEINIIQEDEIKDEIEENIDEIGNEEIIEYGDSDEIIENQTYDIQEEVESLENTEELIIDEGEIQEENDLDTKNQDNSEDINIIPIFQSPSYLSDLTLGLDKYECDSSKEICKLNFNLVEDNDDYSNLGSEYSCNWDIGFETNVDLGKCNINTLEIPIGENIISYNIYKNDNLYLSNSIKIINNGFLESDEANYEEDEEIEEDEILDTIRIIDIKKPEIEIQSGLDEDYNCEDKDCRVNFIHHRLNSKFGCEWIFNNATYKNSDTKKCNPSYVNFSSGDSGVYLKVYQKNFPSNFSMTYITVKNHLIEEEKEVIQEKIIDQENTIELNNSDNLLENIIENNSDKILEQQENTQKLSYSGSLKITEVLPNPKGKDLYEYIEITNFLDKELSLSGCYLKEKNTNKKFRLDEYLIEKKLKIYQYESNIHLNNTKGFNLELNCFDELIDNFIWENKSVDDFVVDREMMGKKIDEINLENDEFSLVGDNLNLKKKYIVNNPLLDLKGKNIPNDEKLDLANDIINDNFSQKLEINNKGFTAYGKTLPGIKITMSLNKIEKTSYLGIGKTYADNIFSSISDSLGNYEIVVNYPLVGEYEIKNYVELTDNYAIKLEEENTLKIDSTKKIIEKEEKNLDEIGIILQTKSTNDNEIYPNKIVCLKDECSINFIASNKQKDLKYLWDFGDGETYIGYNPSYHKYKLGTYIASLEIKSLNKYATKYFVVEVSGKTTKKSEITQAKAENISKEIIEEKQNLVQSKNNMITLKQNNFFSKELILTILIFLNFLLLSFLVLKNKKMI